MLQVEAPKYDIIDNYGGVQSIGDVWHIYEVLDLKTGLKGAYYRLSKHLTLQTYQGFFTGDCEPVPAVQG